MPDPNPSAVHPDATRPILPLALTLGEGLVGLVYLVYLECLVCGAQGEKSATGGRGVRRER